MKCFFTLHYQTIHPLPPVSASFNHLDVVAVPQGMIDPRDRLVTACAYIILPRLMSLPPFYKADPLGDNPVAYLFRSSHETVVKGDVGVFPARCLACLDPVVIPVLEVSGTI